MQLDHLKRHSSVLRRMPRKRGEDETNTRILRLQRWLFVAVSQQSLATRSACRTNSFKGSSCLQRDVFPAAPASSRKACGVRWHLTPPASLSTHHTGNVSYGQRITQTNMMISKSMENCNCMRPYAITLMQIVFDAWFSRSQQMLCLSWWPSVDDFCIYFRTTKDEQRSATAIDSKQPFFEEHKRFYRGSVTIPLVSYPP